MEKRSQYGKREEGRGEQPYWKPPRKNIRLHKGSEDHLEYGYGKDEMKLLVDNGAEFCLLKHSSLKEETVYNPSTTIDVMKLKEH
jgi:hypothetical protein